MPNGIGDPPLVDSSDPISVGKAIQWLVLAVYETYHQGDDIATLKMRMDEHDRYHGKEDVNIANRLAVKNFYMKPLTLAATALIAAMAGAFGHYLIGLLS